MGDGRTYDYTIGIRAVTSIDGMTSDFARIPWEVLQTISARIVNEVGARQPRRLRHHEQTAGYDRVGVGEIYFFRFSIQVDYSI